MNDFTFFWHDYETFGRVPRRDRPAQFAGLRTNSDLVEIDEPVMLYCKPAPDSLPDPEACLLTGITPQICLEKGVSELAFANTIESHLGKTGTIGVGYNSIGFDDEVTRHLFWRNLIDPYAREWQNQCGRWDLMDVVRLTWALRPEGIQWPIGDDGKPSFKLERLTQANGLAHEAAHDALSDVRATVALARLIKTSNPKLWDFCLRMRRKEEVTQEIGVGKPFLHVSGRYGTDRGCLALLWPLATHPTNKSEIIAWDLAHDPEELFHLDAEHIRLRLFSKAEDLPQGMARLPLRTLAINKSPMVIGHLKTLSAQRAAQFNIDIAQGLAYSTILAQRGDALRTLWPEVFARAKPQDVDVDEDLYGGFISTEDRRTLQHLRKLQPEQLATRHPSFSDPRLDEILFRYRARNFPGSLSPPEQQRWQTHVGQRLHQGAGGSRTLQGFFDQLDALNETADERGQDILSSLYDYAEAIAPALE
jgi:exodeoxyribonuclease I